MIKLYNQDGEPQELEINSPKMEDVFMKGWEEWELYQEEEEDLEEEEPKEEEPSNVINLLDAINHLREERGC